MSVNVTFTVKPIPTQVSDIYGGIYSRPEYAHIKDIGEIKAAANLTDPVKIAADIEKRTIKAKQDLMAANHAKTEALVKEYRATALDGLAGHVGFLTFAINEQKPVALQGFVSHDDGVRMQPWHGAISVAPEEFAVLPFFAAVDEAVEKDIDESSMGSPDDAGELLLIGHDVRRSLTFLHQRAMCLGIPVPTWLRRARFDRGDVAIVHDTMEMCGCHRPGGHSLDHICRGLGIPAARRWTTPPCGTPSTTPASPRSRRRCATRSSASAPCTAA